MTTNVTSNSVEMPGLAVEPSAPETGRFKFYIDDVGALRVVGVAGPTTTGVPLDDAEWLAYQPQVRGFFMQRTSIEADETVTIPSGHALVTTLPFENDGAVEVNGRLVVLGSAAEAEVAEFEFAAVSAVYDHNALRENVHGIADTRLLETQAGAQARVDALGVTVDGIGVTAAAAAPTAWVTSNYYARTDFSAAPTAAEPLKANGAGGISLKIVTGTKFMIGYYDALQTPSTGQVLLGRTNFTGTNVTALGYYAGNGKNFNHAIAIGAYASPTKNNQAVIGSSTSNIDALTVVSGASGGALEAHGKSSTTAAQAMARLEWSWSSSTHATRKAQAKIYASDYGGERLCATFGADGAEALAGLYGVAPVARQLLATGAGATVDDVITVLQNFGIAKQS